MEKFSAEVMIQNEWTSTRSFSMFVYGNKSFKIKK